MEVQAEKHFSHRAALYNASSSWVTDENLSNQMFILSKANKDSLVLDLATGTGQVAKRFKDQVKKVVGIDVCEKMLSQAKENLDEIFLAEVETMTFPDNYYNVCICRQGLQFMDLSKALSQAHRVLKPQGRVVFCHLISYPEESDSEREITFEIQRLRNPARKNFFTHETISNELNKLGFRYIDTTYYPTVESINRWIENGSIDDERKNRIRSIYRNSSSSYQKIHQIKFSEKDIFDTMLMSIVTAVK